MPAAPGAESVAWGGLACRSSAMCIDVGQGFPGGDASPISLVAEWNGKRWHENTPDEHSTVASDVFWGPSSCAASLGCLILGNNNAGDPPLSQQSASLWTGSRWLSFPAPSATTTPPGGAIQISGLSCPGGTCIAVGSTGSSPAQTLIERYS